MANNNIFCGSDKVLGTLGGGISGTDNWLQSTATMPAHFHTSITGSDPDFVNRAARDVHLTAASGCRNWGLNALLIWTAQGRRIPGCPHLSM